ncbi:MAG: hydroxyethylthiazole kinase [Leptotrichiaceae bacterium]|nr:hydroxyethylthiazole kinase [Leptotrichiaceae bacterium]
MSNLSILRKKNPLIVCITNDVVKNYTANGLIALGASPAMSEYKEDLEDILKYSDGLLINIGTLTDISWKLYKDALDIAEKYNVPAVLDPVVAGAGKFRQKVVSDLLNNHKISLIRGNAGEVAALIGADVKSKGVDSAECENTGELAKKANEKLNIPILITGKTDAIAVDGEVITLHNGSCMMPKIIGTGCLLGAVMAAFINIGNEKLINRLEEGLSVYNIAGEMAEKTVGIKSPGTFQIEFLNALYNIRDEDVVKYRKVRKYV